MPKRKKHAYQEKDQVKKAKPLVRDSEESKLAMVSRLRLARLERSVSRHREQLRQYVAPKPVESRAERYNKLRGAARPWTEVVAAANYNHHDIPEDLIEKYGQELCSVSEKAREFRDALIELARFRFEENDTSAGRDLCAEAISIDAGDLGGAGLLAVAMNVSLAMEKDSPRCMPAWTYFMSDPESASIPSDSINPYAIFCVAYPDAFDACLEYLEEIDLSTVTPTTKLEAIILHHHLRTCFTDDLASFRKRAARLLLETTDVSTRTMPQVSLPSNDESPPQSESHNFSMYYTMFDTALDMART